MIAAPRDATRRLSGTLELLLPEPALGLRDARFRLIWCRVSWPQNFFSADTSSGKI